MSEEERRSSHVHCPVFTPRRRDPSEGTNGHRAAGVDRLAPSDPRWMFGSVLAVSSGEMSFESQGLTTG